MSTSVRELAHTKLSGAKGADLVLERAIGLIHRAGQTFLHHRSTSLATRGGAHARFISCKFKQNGQVRGDADGDGCTIGAHTRGDNGQPCRLPRSGHGDHGFWAPRHERY
jgi:hypothetical protein